MIFDAKSWVTTKFEHRIAGQQEFSICCPFCGDKRFRLYICTDPNQKSKTGKLFPCWCHNEQQAYNLAEIYSAIENIDIIDAISVMEGNGEAPYASIQEMYDEMFPDDVKDVYVDKPVSAPFGYVSLWGINKDTWASTVPYYLLKRNVTYEMCQKYTLGFTKKSRDVWSDRLVIPIYMDGKVVTLQGRAMYDTKTMKYYFQKIQNPNIRIGDCLYGIDMINKRDRSAILVEGAFDVWAMKNAGYNNTIASFGKHLTKKCRDRILGNFDDLYICWDKDAKNEIAELVKELYGWIRLHIVNMQGKDPDESTKEQIDLSIGSSKLVDDYLVTMIDICIEEME